MSAWKCNVQSTHREMEEARKCVAWIQLLWGKFSIECFLSMMDEYFFIPLDFFTTFLGTWALHTNVAVLLAIVMTFSTERDGMSGMVRTCS